MQMRSQMRRAKDIIQGAMSADKAHSMKKHIMLLALKSGMGGFEKVVGMVDGMVEVPCPRLRGPQPQVLHHEWQLSAPHPETRTLSASSTLSWTSGSSRMASTSRSRPVVGLSPTATRF